MRTDSELLREHVETGSEAAFTALVQRHAGLVYRAALRLMDGDGPVAEDIAQEVFILLARKAPMLVRHETLAGWLHTTTRYAALRTIRNLRRRKDREQEAVLMETQSTPEVQWEQLRPLLDEAVGRLDDRDRNAVLLRYFQGCSHREVGAALGLSENTAQARVDRALAKLHRYFERHGVATTAALLAEALAANSAQAAPAGLVTKMAAVARAKDLGLGHALFKALYMTTKTKIAMTAAVITAAFVTGWFGAEIAGHPASPRAGAAASQRTSAKNSVLSATDLLAQARADLARLLRTPGETIRERTVLDFVEKLDAGTAKALLDDYASKPLNPENEEALSDLAYRWAELESEAAVAWLQGLDDRNVQNLCAQNIFDAYSVKDPAAALGALAKLPASFNLIQLVVATLLNFGEKDPQGALAALAALRALPNGQKFQTATFVIFQAWAETDPAAAAAEALKLPVGIPSPLNSIASTWAEQDPTAAMVWANALPADQSRNTVDEGIITGLSEHYPAAAADYFANLPNDPLKDFVLPEMARTWAQEDPAGLLAWADKNLTGTVDVMATLAALNMMGYADPAGAAAYLAQNTDPNVTNQAIPALAAKWARQDPQAALAWTLSLPTDDRDLRDSALTEVFTGWSSTNQAAAAAYLQQSLGADPSFGTFATGMVKSWGNTDAQAALNWANNLPPGVGQNNAVVGAITTLAEVETRTVASAAAQKAMANLAGLTPAQQTALQKIADQTVSP